MARRTGPDGAGSAGALHLGSANSPLAGRVGTAWRLLLQPRGAVSVLAAWASGRRLRARQRLAALVGIDHRLALPPAILDRYRAPAPEPRTFFWIGAQTAVPGAAGRVAAAFAAEPGLQAVYGDALVAAGLGVLPLLPPSFDPDLLLGVGYIGLLAVRPGALGDGPAPTGPTDAALRIFERHGRGAIGRFPGILALGGAGTGGENLRVREAAVRAHLDRTGRAGSALAADPDGLIRVTHPLTETPPVSLIVPTRDRLDLLRPCLDSLRTRTDWPDVEILVCDNDSREPETLAYLRALEGERRATVVPWPGPFNFAAMNNAAAARARGRLLVFVNNDVEAFRPDWLGLMAREALRPDVGAVGAKLLDGAGRIQHGGIVLGTGGLVTHGHRHFSGDAPGYLSALRATHAVSAVTAACLMVEAEKFRSVGGFDEKNFPVDFNDVDLCLRLNAAGLRTLLVPGAVLHHREAASRRWTPEARARHAREIAALKERWGPLLAQDPHYNSGFDPDLSTHARLARGFPADRPVRRSGY